MGAEVIDGAPPGVTNGAASANVRKIRPDVPDPQQDTRPKITIALGQPQAWISAAISALRADPDIYTRDADLAHVTRITEEEAEESEWVDLKGRKQRALIPGSPKIHTMTLPTLRVRMAQWATWERPKFGKNGWEDIPCEPSKAQAEELRDEGRWPGLRRLTGVSETPFPRPDLSIVQGERHYDRATGYLYEPSMAFPIVADAPTRDDARASRLAFVDLFSDFPFASPAGSSASLALLLTMLCRPAILGPVPAWIIDATTPGTGKTLLADCCAGIAHGRDAGRAHFPAAGRNSDEELGKRLGMFARMGARFVCFDNADDAMIGGDVLEEVITVKSTYTFRILGKTDGLTLPVQIVFVFTANNAQWSRGMNRRIIHVRLESPFADPEHRPLDSYAHPERAGRLFAYVLENRAEYVRHALTIIRAYAHANCPDALTLGTFEQWAALIASAIVWAGGEDPMLCRPGADGEESPDTLQRQTLAREWDALCRASGKDGFTAHDIVDRLYPDRQKGEPLDKAWDDFRGAIEFFVPPRRAGDAPDAGKLSDVMSRRLKGAPIRTHDAPAPLRRFERVGKSGGRARWAVVNVPTYQAKSGPVVAHAALVARLQAESTEQGEAPCPVCAFPRGHGPSLCDPCTICGRCVAQAPHHPDGCHC